MSERNNLDKVLRYRWLIFAILALSYVLVYFHRLCTAVVAEDIRIGLDVTGDLVGLFGSAYFYPYALMQLPAGLLSDSWGPRKTITVFFGVAFAGSIILGFSNSILTALLGRTIVGIGVSMLFVPTMKILAEWFRAREFAGMTGILVAMGGVGSIIATRPLAELSDLVGWRGSFLIVGTATLVIGILVWLLVRDRPADKGWPSPLDDVPNTKEKISLIDGVKTVLGSASFWPLALWFFFCCAVFFSFIGLWGGPYYMHVYNMDNTQAGGILAFSAFGMIVASPLYSIVSNRIVKGRKPVIIFASFMTVLITACLVMYTDQLPKPALYGLTFLMGVFTNAIVVIGFTTAKELFPVSIAGTSTGLVNLFPFLGGALLQPVMGKILEMGGKTADGGFTVEAYKNAFIVMVVCAVLAFICSLFITETLGKDVE
jgi:sugar phosphate permease